MAESSLSIEWKEVQARVASFLGWGLGAYYADTAWTTKRQFELDGIVASGLRQFYFPAPLEGESGSYNWSFLRPVADLTMPSGDAVIALPDDFGGFEGQITYSSDTTNAWWPLELIGEGSVRQKYVEFPNATGSPQMAALQPLKYTDKKKGQRFQLYVWPTPDQDYTVQVAYYILPEMLREPFPFPYGGAEHAETILESCLAIAEQRLDDASLVHTMKFQERMRASVSMDRRKKPQVIGYNGDTSDDRRWSSRRDMYGSVATTWSGTAYP